MAKRTVQTINNANGTTDVTFEFNVQNYGTTNLTNIAVAENLASVFSPCGTPTVLSLTSDDYTVNAAFTGAGANTNLLAAGNTLTVGNKGAILLTIRIPACATTSFTNTATLTGTTPTNTTVTDISQNGAEADPDNDGNPNNNGVGTPVNTTSSVSIGLAKRVSYGPVLLPNNQYEFTYEVNVTNLGSVDLYNLSVIENLAATFAGAGSWTLVGLESEEFAVNTNFTGSGANTQLLAPGNTLAAGNEGAIYIKVRVAPGLNNLYINSVTGSGVSPNGTNTTDISDNGSDVDADDDNQPNEPGENDPTPVDLPCFIGIICPQVVSPIVVQNDQEWCNAMVNFPPAVPITCAGAETPLIEYQLSGVGAENVTNGVWIVGQPSGLRYKVGTTNVRIRARLGAVGEEGTLISTECNFDIKVLDKQNPNAICKDITIFLDANGNAAITPTSIDGGSFDNCGVITRAISKSTFNCSNVGPNQVVLTITDGAVPPNTSTCVAIVTVVDNIPPTFTCPAPITVDGCNDLTPDVITGIVNEADNCGVQSTTQNPVAGLDFGQISGNVLNITVTVTDVNGNQTTCVVPVTIDDDDAPDFVNCPTAMIMIGNDPDQCGGKVNWQPPVALDDCLPLPIAAAGNPLPGTIVQTGGPLPGSNVAITCPPTPSTITYVATDGSGNQSTCVFQVMVVDTEKPEFDADIIMPNDTTVNCHQVPTNCVYHGPNVCTPLTNNDVNDNCTSPQNLVIQYTELSTQNPNPAVCANYHYQLTRTWSVKDCAGNNLVHVQKITVQDTTKPTAICQNIALVLDKNGKTSIVPANINNGSFDNCAAANVLTYELIGLTTFTCANIGVNTVTLKVTDPCGNFATCTATVTISEGIAPCTPQYSVQTTCLDNASNQDNGQFLDIITIKSLAMQTWTITANSTNNGQGLYLANSPAPPASPALISIGTPFQAGTADGIDNDNDGQTDEADEMIYYTLRAKHVECQGYAISVSNATNIGMAPSATTGTISNKACYPNPYFLNLYDPFCLGTPPFTIKVGEYNNAQGNVINVMVDGVPTTTFNAAALGIGSHTVMATFDAGTATQNLVINGVQVGGSLQDAFNDPGCQQKITKVVQVVSTPTQLVCDDLVYVSLDADCADTLNADNVLEGSYFCYDDYKLEIDKVAPFGNGPWSGGIFNASDIGKTYTYKVTHIDGNICWGEIKIEDKLVPALNCPDNITVACSESTGTQHTGNIAIQDCSPTTTVIDDNYTDFGECSNPRGRIVRTWIVTDASGNQSTCAQTITITPFNLADIVFPADITLNCEVAYLNPGATQPDQTGRPSINGFAIGVGGLCTASINYTDERFDICPGSYEILRTWKIRNTCFAVSANNPIEHVQVIRLKDLGGPAFLCPANVTVSTDPLTCCATAALPDVIVSEGCSNISGLQAKVTGTNPVNGNIITFTVPGYLGDFAGNNYWNPDTLAIFPYTQCIPQGVYNVQYSAEDQCGNVSKCAFQMTVADLVPPTATCDEFTQVALGGDGMAFINASTFDDGSKDNCAPVEFKARRMSANACQTDTLFHDQVKFCCADINDTIMVVFRVYDVDVPSGPIARDAYEGRYNDCMVQVLVEDKIKPTCNAPANVSVSCENFDPTLWAYGKAEVLDNCCLDTTKVYQGQIGLTHSINYSQFDTTCNKGTITRTFRAFDCGGNSSQCTQRVFVTYEQDYFVRFPNDVIVSKCDGTGNFGAPTFFGEDCELLGVSFEDEIFTVVPDACFKIERTWTVINWCTFNPNLGCINVPNPSPNATTNNPANLPGVVVSPAGTPAPWNPTVVKINSTDATATNYATFYDANANCYKYKQIIKIIDTQDPVANCPASPVEFCDLTVNDNQLWNASYWWDNSISSHDLCEGETDLSITATDSCSGANVNFRYILYLDLDGDNVMETVVSSSNVPGVNTIQYGNANNPNFSGGEARNFDGRPVPFNQQYRFAIDWTSSGKLATAKVRFDNLQAPVALPAAGNNTLQGVVPQLPYGTHKIKWIVEDGCGNETVCEYNFTVKDCKKPTVVCLNGLTVNIMPTQMINLWASDFLQYTEDNCTPANQLKIAIRKSGDPTPGFPQDAQGNPISNVTFSCAELGTQLVKLWSIDKAGNADFCETYVIVQDNMGNCPPGSGAAKVAGQLSTEGNNGVEESNVGITGAGNGIPAFTFATMTDGTGLYNFNAIPLASNSTVTPEKDDNPLNGVSTYDLVLISKHILGIQSLDSPYKMIAADANKSGSITTFDIVEIRKLILGIYNELPNNTSWRFVDKSYNFPNVNNPFAAQFPENKSIVNLSTNLLNEDFVSVKVGDVNGNAIANSAMSSDDRSTGTLLFDVDDKSVTAGETFTVSLTAAEAVAGYQFTMNHPGLEVVDITPGSNMSSGNFGIFTDAITTSFDGANQGAFSVTFRATKGGKLSEMLSVSSRITKAEAYPAFANASAGKLNVAFRFNNGATSTVSGVGFELYQNQPNPFVNKTFIGFHLPEATTATLSIFDETGRMVYNQKAAYAKGYNTISIDKALLNTVGMLYYKLETATDSATKKMIQTK